MCLVKLSWFSRVKYAVTLALGQNGLICTVKYGSSSIIQPLTAQRRCFPVRSPEDFERQKAPVSPVLHSAAAWQRKNRSHLSNSRLRDSHYLQATETTPIHQHYFTIYIPKATFSILRLRLIMMSIHPFSITTVLHSGSRGVGADPNCLEAAAGWHPWKVSTLLHSHMEANNPPDFFFSYSYDIFHDENVCWRRIFSKPILVKIHIFKLAYSCCQERRLFQWCIWHLNDVFAFKVMQ